jgi:hypothetical protein
MVRQWSLLSPQLVPDSDAHHRALTVCNELVAKLKPPNAVATRTDAAKALQDFLAFASKQALLTAKEAAREAGAIPPLILAASAAQHASDENQVDLGESALCALATVARDEHGKNKLAIRSTHDAHGTGANAKNDPRKYFGAERWLWGVLVRLRLVILHEEMWRPRNVNIHTAISRDLRTAKPCSYP